MLQQLAATLPILEKPLPNRGAKQRPVANSTLLIDDLRGIVKMHLMYLRKTPQPKRQLPFGGNGNRKPPLAAHFKRLTILRHGLGRMVASAGTSERNGKTRRESSAMEREGDRIQFAVLIGSALMHTRPPAAHCAQPSSLLDRVRVAH